MNFQKGTLLVEILVATIVLGTILLTTAGALNVALDAIQSEKLQNQASFLLQEEMDPLLTIRDKGWANGISTNGTYYMGTSGNSWQLVATTSGETVGKFTRSVVISDTYRDSNGQIVASGGTVDASTKKAVGTVSWQTTLPHSISATTYITRYKDNLQWIQTSQADFNAGTKIGTTITNSSGGEVILGSGGGHGGDWCAPNLNLTQIDLPKSGVANALTAVVGEAFAGTGDNASGVSFANVTIDPNSYPPDASVVGTFDGYKTNGVFGETNYGYLATDNNFKEIVIIDLTQKDANNKYSESGYFDAPGNGNGSSVFVSGNIGYMTDGTKLYTFDLSSKAGSRPQLGNVTLAATGNKVFVVGKYAYVVTASTTTQLQVFEVSTDGKTITLVGQKGVAGQAGKDIFVTGSGTRAYLATGTSSSQREVFIIDVSTKAAVGSPPVTFPSPVGSYDTNGMDPKGVTVATLNKAIIVGSGGYEYQVIDITNETSPTLCGASAQLNIDTGVNGVSSVIEPDGDVYSYIITGDSSSEFKIIEGGGGGHNFSASGTFESSTFDAGFGTAFNRFIVTYGQPSQTTLQFKVSGADVGSDGTCNTATFIFVGPDGQSSSFFTPTGSPYAAAVPFSPGPGYKNSARCFRYRAYFTTSDTTQTPVLYDFTLNYSP